MGKTQKQKEAVMRTRRSLYMIVLAVLIVLGITASAQALIDGGGDKHAFTEDFMLEECTFSHTGVNPFFNLVPGFQLVLEGEDEKEEVRVEITVLDETEMVDGVETRVVEEVETKDGELAEISRNFFVICEETKSVLYFGEDVDIYEDGVIVSNDGAWRAGEDGAEPGIIMPGTILLGSRYFQEIAPGIAMDRAEHVRMNVTVETPKDIFAGCIEVKETTPIEPNAKDIKIYAPGIGLVVDGPIELTDYTSP
jgi:hypothetical protein